MSKTKVARELALNLMREMGLKSPLMDDAARTIIEKKAAKVGLPDVVYHSSPHGFSSIRGGEDQFIHVAEDPRVALDRLSAIRKSIKEPVFDLTPEEAKKLQVSKDDIEKAGYLYEMFTKLGKPLDVRDFGQFNIQHLLEEQKNIRDLLDDSTKEKLQELINAGEEILDQYLNTRNTKSRAALANLMHDLEKEQMRVFSSALKEKGYGSLRYRNTFEVPKEYDKLKDELRDITFRITEVDKTIDELVSEGADKSIVNSLKNEKLKLRAEYEKKEKQMPLSYALFPDTPTRHTSAKFAKDKIQSNPNDMLLGLAGATGAGLTASTMMPEDAEASIVTELGDIAKKVGKLKSPTVLDLRRELNLPKTYRSQKQVGQAHRAASNLLDFASREGMGMQLSDRPDKVLNEYIKINQPDLRGQVDDIIVGASDPYFAEDEFIRDYSRILRNTEGMSSADAIRQAQSEIPGMAGAYMQDYLKSFNLADGSQIYGPGKIYIFGGSPNIGIHELEHFRNHVTDPLRLRLLNNSYTFSPNIRSHSKTHPWDAIDRLGEFEGLQPNEIYKDLADKKILSVENGRYYTDDLEQTKKAINYLSDRFKLLPSKPSYSFGNHMFDYDHFELEKAAELLNNQVRNPSDISLNRLHLKNLTSGKVKPEDAPALLEKMRQRSAKSPILNEKQNQRLSELEKEFGSEEI